MQQQSGRRGGAAPARPGDPAGTCGSARVARAASPKVAGEGPAQQRDGPSTEDVQRQELENRIAQLENDLAKAKRNLAIEEDPGLREAVRDEYRQINQQLSDAKQQRDEITRPAASAGSVEAEVDQAMALLDDIDRITTDPSARADIPRIVNQLQLWVGLNFVEGIKGKKRRVRRLTGGVIGFGPMTISGAVADTKTDEPATLPAPGDGTAMAQNQQDAGWAVQPADDENRRDGISFTNGNRGDWI